MKVSKNFIIQELVPQSVYAQFGDKSIWFVDINLINMAQSVRDFFGVTVTINNWHSKGTLQNRGYRIPLSEVGGKMSQHKFGRAVDISFKDLTVTEAYDKILKNEKLFMSFGLTTLEDILYTKTWLHLDIRNTGLIDKILIVKP
ncbi:MAG TPA: hypothetical protein VJ201_04430 [Candidatus Babeliales bacterium]|nr:hypothetical protein [Candidatus Babeliales bacterium]